MSRSQQQLHAQEQENLENLDKKARLSWNSGSVCIIYLRSEDKWKKGQIEKIIDDDNDGNEWLMVRYDDDDNTKTLKIERNSKEIKPFDKKRASWTFNSFVMIYSRSNNQWYTGRVANISKDEHEQEWLSVKYDNNRRTKKIQRNSKDIKPIPNDHPSLFKIGSLCAIYSHDTNQWHDGEVVDIFNDDEGEWLKVKYDEDDITKTCDIQRHSKEIKMRISKFKLSPQIDTNSNFDEKDEEKFVEKYSTKQSIECAHLCATIISDFFNADKNVCEIRAKENENLLDKKYELNGNVILANIVLFGGTVRDYKLGRTIKDIDIQVNTRELNKLHALHLQTYHKTLTQQHDSKNCVFWRLYLNKYKSQNENENGNDVQIENKNSYQYIANCNYILNTNFIVDILLNSQPFSGRYQCKRYTGHWPSADIVIDKDLFYKNVNLKGVNIDICIDPLLYKPDYPDINKADYEPDTNVDDTKQDDTFKYGRLRRYSSINLMDLPMNAKMAKTKKDEKEKALEIILPIYDTKLISVLSVCDFSINCLMYPLSNFINKQNESYYDWNNIDEYLCALPHHYDILKDFQEKILRQNDVKNVLLIQTPPRYFLRLIKFAVRMEDWQISSDLIQTTKYFYYVWLNSDKFWVSPSLRNNYKFFISGIFTYSGAKTIKNYKRMMQLFDENTLDFTRSLLTVIKKYKHIEKLFVNEINNIAYNDKPQIINLFKSNGFPTQL